MNIPIFSSSQIHLLISELERHLNGLTCLTCISTGVSRFLLLFKGKGRKEALSFCLASPFLRFHLTAFPSELASLHPLQSALSGSKVKTIKQLNKDRILQLSFQSTSHTLHLIVEFFKRHPNYYLVDDENKILFSLFPLENAYYHLPSRPLSTLSSFRLLANSAEVERVYNQFERDWLFQKAKKAIELGLQQRLKYLKKGKILLEQKLEACSKWKTIQHEGEILKTYFYLLKKGLTSVNVWDWQQEQLIELSLNPQYTPQQELVKRFRRAKKLQAGLSYLQSCLSQIQLKLKELKLQIQALEHVQNEEDLQPFKPKIKSEHPLKKDKRLKLPYQEYRSKTGLAIWVGKNACSNEYLTFSLSKGSDWWLHTQDVAGSHVIIRTRKGQDPDPETLADALQLALYHSKAKERLEADICLTQRKYVSRLGKNQPGKVQISKHKVMWIQFDQQRYQALKQRQADERIP